MSNHLKEGRGYDKEPTKANFQKLFEILPKKHGPPPPEIFNHVHLCFLNDTLFDGHFAFATTDGRQDDRKCDRSLNANADGRVRVEVSDIFRVDLSVVGHLTHEEGHAAQVRERASLRRKNFCEK